MPNKKTAVRFENVSFGYSHAKPLLESVNFSVREGATVLVSHVPEFVDKIRIDQVLDLEK